MAKRAKTAKPVITGIIRDTRLVDALGERYLSYALSTIMSRSLPDVRDGLKPVHRRLLYAMRQLKLDPKSGFKKCARVVGDVMGKYHPHGDASIYDAMVRLSQEFAVRYPMVDGQGVSTSVVLIRIICQMSPMWLLPPLPLSRIWMTASSMSLSVRQQKVQQ